jgi:hypothetical protein
MRYCLVNRIKHATANHQHARAVVFIYQIYRTGGLWQGVYLVLV